MNTPETGKGRRIEELNSFVDRELEIILDKADSLGHENQESWQKLDSLFLRLLNIQ